MIIQGIKWATLVVLLLSLVAFSASAVEGRKFGDPLNGWFVASMTGGGGEAQDRFSRNGVLTIFLHQSEKTPRHPIELLEFRIQQVQRLLLAVPGASQAIPTDVWGDGIVLQSSRRGFRVERGGTRLATIDLGELNLEPGLYRIAFRVKSVGIMDAPFDSSSIDLPVVEFIVEPPLQPEEGGQ